SNYYIFFEPGIITSTSFQATLDFNRDPFIVRSRSVLYMQLESGGLPYNFFKPKYLENKGIQFYQYVKFLMNYRKYFPVSENSNIVLTFNPGVAYPYGKNKIVPFTKRFTLGGTKMRGWPYGLLGPGKFSQGLENADDRSIRNGDIQLYAALEWSRPLFWKLGASLFFESGNVWAFNEEEGESEDALDNGVFKWGTFAEELAFSGGYTIDLRFSPLVVSLGVGIRLKDPSGEPKARWLWDELSIKSLVAGDSYSQFFFNIGYNF
ncbi:MAG: BamA/TamA family outer membrane protein, partial [Cytophagales bacterium]|nr:BamA/TamA family outer membrane protein [Cytophagales bacterium]